MRKNTTQLILVTILARLSLVPSVPSSLQRRDFSIFEEIHVVSCPLTSNVQANIIVQKVERKFTESSSIIIMHDDHTHHTALTYFLIPGMQVNRNRKEEHLHYYH